MLQKPDSCRGCPFYSDGKGFVPDLIRDGSEVFIYAQNPGGSEERGERWTGTDFETHPIEPLIGRTGYIMDTTFLPLAGLNKDQISIGNSIRCRYKHKDELPALDTAIVKKAMAHCHQAHFKLPPATKLIVAQGEYALYALTQEGTEKHNKVSDWRGYVLPLEPLGTSRTFMSDVWTPGTGLPIPVLSTYHLAYLFRDPTASFVTKIDWRKIQRILARKWPQPLPKITEGPPLVWPMESAFDTEFVPESNHFLCYSLYDGKTLRFSEELSTGQTDYHFISKPTVIMHNALADLPFLEQILPGGFNYEDTMHGHSVLWSDFDHDLGFIGSIYASINRWKHLIRTNPQVYSVGDAYVTWFLWEEGLKKEFDRDPASLKVYRDYQLKLVPVIRVSEKRGVRVNHEKSEEAYYKRLRRMEELGTKAEAITGWPINLRSNLQVGHHLFEVEGLLDLVG